MKQNLKTFIGFISFFYYFIFSNKSLPRIVKLLTEFLCFYICSCWDWRNKLLGMGRYLTYLVPVPTKIGSWFQLLSTSVAVFKKKITRFSRQIHAYKFDYKQNELCINLLKLHSFITLTFYCYNFEPINFSYSYICYKKLKLLILKTLYLKQCIRLFNQLTKVNILISFSI